LRFSAANTTFLVASTFNWYHFIRRNPAKLTVIFYLYIYIERT